MRLWRVALRNAARNKRRSLLSGSAITVATLTVVLLFSLLGGTIGYRVTGIFRGAWNPGIMLSAVLFGVAASMATALLPARRALRLDVAQCLRHE